MRACTFTLEMCACYTLGKHMQEIPEIEEKRVPKLYEPQLSLNTKDQKKKTIPVWLSSHLHCFKNLHFELEPNPAKPDEPTALKDLRH